MVDPFKQHFGPPPRQPNLPRGRSVPGAIVSRPERVLGQGEPACQHETDQGCGQRGDDDVWPPEALLAAFPPAS
jgi:hypothetical protein